MSKSTSRGRKSTKLVIPDEIYRQYWNDRFESLGIVLPEEVPVPQNWNCKRHMVPAVPVASIVRAYTDSGVNKEDVAALSGVGPRVVFRIVEQGCRYCEFETADKILTAFHDSWRWFSDLEAMYEFAHPTEKLRKKIAAYKGKKTTGSASPV